MSFIVVAVFIGFIAVPAYAVHHCTADSADHGVHRDFAAPYPAAYTVHINDRNHILCTFRRNLIHEAVNVAAALSKFPAPFLNRFARLYGILFAQQLDGEGVPLKLNARAHPLVHAPLVDQSQGIHAI